MTTATLIRTPLYDAHVALGAKLVPFAGFEMPIQYTNLIEEHNAVRTVAGLFDVGHMGVVKVEETEKFKLVHKNFLSRVIDDMEPGKIRYNRIIRPDRTVVDDILVYRDFENYLIVFNASNIQKDTDYFAAQGITCSSMGLHLIALQGPDAEKILQAHTEEELDKIKYYGFIATEIDGIDMIISRTGYTGEPGFELMVAAADCELVWNMFINDGVKPCGLGARDTLRIEAGMPLYGHELKDEWTTEHSDTVVGLKMLEKGGVPRQGYVVENIAGTVIGEITSGTFSPTLQEPVAIAIAKASAVGDVVNVVIRNNRVKAQVVALPFINKLRKKK